ASEIRMTARLLAHKSILAVVLVSVNSHGEISRMAASTRLYRSSADSRRHGLMTNLPGYVGRMRAKRQQTPRTSGSAPRSPGSLGFGCNRSAMSCSERTGAEVERLHVVV